MAYVSKADKARLAPAIKAVLKKYNMKGSISVNNHSTLRVKVTSGSIEFETCEGYHDVNVYWIDTHFAGIERDFLNELLDAMKGVDYFNNDDAMTDYFSRSHYTDITIGTWNKPYVYTGCNIDPALRADPTKAAYIIAA